MAKTVGLLSPGEMGKVVGQVLIEHGMSVVTCLEGRSERTAVRAREVGIECVSTYGDLVADADILLSILVPAEAPSAASAVASEICPAQLDLLYVDCNAIAPTTTCRIGQIITAAGGRFADAGIIGPPPRAEGLTRFYASGEHAADFAALGDYGLDVRVIGDEIGQASSLKMCYAASTKGRFAIFLELLAAVRKMGLYDALIAELGLSQPAVLADMERMLPGIPPKSGRWIGEMEEIATTFGDLGMTAEIFHGVADIYRFVSGAHRGGDPMSDENVGLEGLVAGLSDRLP